MPFGISWGQYLKMWAVCIGGYAAGSQLIYSQYKPMEKMELLVEKEVEKLREARNLKKPTFEDRMKKVRVLDEEYLEKFKLKQE